MGKRYLPLAHFSDLTASPNDRFAPILLKKSAVALGEIR
jgi:hypothetical protein